MAGDFYLTNHGSYPKAVQCPWCDAGDVPTRKVTVPITIWGSDEVQYASLDESVYNKISDYARVARIMDAQRRFRIHRSLLQARRRNQWM